MSANPLPPDTPEQALVTQYKGAKLVVIAFAGTGKTTTLIKYARENPGIRMLYVAFNRAIRDEAAAKFPENVECKTSHQIAYAVCGKKYRKKHKNNLHLRDIAGAINTGNWELAKDVEATFNTFLSSSDDTVLMGHTPRGATPRSLTSDQQDYKESLIIYAKQLWKMMIDLESEFPMTHDGYLKLYQLSNPRLSHRYGAILFDEAQDANPVTSDIILRQACIVIFVGDRHQQIYRFRGADNALDIAQMADAHRLYLTNSFRFGPQVAMVANAILKVKGEQKKLVGRGGEDAIGMRLPDDIKHRAVLHRTVIGTLSTALSAAACGERIYWIGGLSSYQVGALEDLYWLSAEKFDNIKRKGLIGEYATFNNYKKIAKATGSAEMKRSVALVEAYDELPKMMANLRAQSVEDEADATITVGTAHRSKGLEWDYVALDEDFPDIFLMLNDKEALADELNLLYVVCTRAMKFLAINGTVESILRFTFSNPDDALL